MTHTQEQGFWKLQRAFNHLLQYRPVDVSALRQIANCQRAVIANMRFPQQVPMFQLLTHRNEKHT